MENKKVTVSEDNLDEISGGNPNGSTSRYKMYEVTCANCGGIALVPLKPETDRPVFCTECWNRFREDNPHM